MLDFLFFDTEFFITNEKLFFAMPEFIWDNIFKLLITVMGTLLLALFTTFYLNKKNEIIRVTGLLLERRLDIYKDILRYFDQLSQKMYIPGKESNLILLEKIGFDLPNGTKFEYSKVFESCSNFENYFSGLEKIILDNKLFLDDESVKELYYIQSYFATVNGLYVSINSFLEVENVKPEEASDIKAKFLKSLGVILDDEVTEICIDLEKILVENIKNMQLKRRNDTYLRKNFFVDENGYVMSRLKDKIIFREKEKLFKLLVSFQML